MEDFERPGEFYLGRRYDLASKETGDPLTYDSKDLVTHGVCVGMTGSGKTGLCVGLLEEAALDGVPSIVIDPKGDLVDLLLTFPELRPEDFLPWVSPEEAEKQGVTLDDFAARQAELWKKGLADWGQDSARIQRLKSSADFAIYTPGSSAGLPVSILKSFTAPGPALRADDEALRDRINTTVTSILGLVGVAADPIQSREHILLSSLFNSAWSAGRDLDLATLIQQIQEPPFQKVGVLTLDSFYPAKDRSVLAMTLNNLLAAPTFQSWLEGEALDIGRMLVTNEGKPRVSIFSIAHLSDSERMFFVSLLLNEVLGWVRAQPGTGSLRAIIYMDEIFGFFPPVAEPPSKRPLLTLLKQARAFGVGILLATQNPVDLDYKGLANAGTWFIGRLQTERDKARLLEGLEGVAAGTETRFDRQKMEQTLAGLGKRVFLLYNVHDDALVTFQTRWTMSYLAGPLTRTQIKTLMDPRRPVAEPATPAPAASAAQVQLGSPAMATTGDLADRPPALPAEIPQYYLPLRGATSAGSTLVYRAGVLSAGTVAFVNTASGASTSLKIRRIAEAPESALTLDWEKSMDLEAVLEDLDRQPYPGATFAPLPAAMAKLPSYRSWGTDFSDWAFRTQTAEVFKSPGFKMTSDPGESEDDFRSRLQRAAHTELSAQTEKLRARYAAKKATLQQRVLRAEQAKDREAERSRGRKMQTAISFGATVLGALFGSKKLGTGTIGRATTTMRDVSRSVDEAGDVKRAEDTLAVVKQNLADLEAEEQAAIDALESKNDPMSETLDRVLMRPRKGDITVDSLGLVWMPYWQAGSGSMTGAWG
ncbi:MAG: ATP-binding protein [Actinobacteria bacterium RBG_16_64_13]|nr:MAG: ATP-binding protein [Actinobacteria bacterium RBG_16_64_13]